MCPLPQLKAYLCPKAWPVYIESFKLVQFRNYDQQLISCSPAFNCFVGRNGMGKTNLLEAVYYLCMGKSHTGLNDQYLNRIGTDFFRLEGIFHSEPGRKDAIVAKVKARQRKELSCNGQVYERLADHVGKYPVVIITPDDTQLVTEGSEERRRLLDNTLSQLDSRYLHQLMLYNQLLRQRNALLKQWEGRPMPPGLLDIYNAQMEEPANYLFESRSRFVEELGRQLAHIYRVIASGQEEAFLSYRSALQQTDWMSLQQQHERQDQQLQRSSAGLHRDELVFQLAGSPLRRIASQGQIKSYVLSLKLAQYQVLRQQKYTAPILLLDDIFDKLDSGRVQQLLGFVLEAGFGQVFISDTDQERVSRLLNSLQADHFLYHIDHGQATRT